jgi:DNA modification methylase
MAVRIMEGDCLTVLRTLPEQSVNCCVTSPPYFGLRDYGHAGQIGLEPTPDEYVAKMVAVFREVRRVLKDDGTVWLNLGDSYATQGGRGEARMVELGRPSDGAKTVAEARGSASGSKVPEGSKPKDLLGIPWRVAFALQADGWYLRSDIIWHKPNPMPESVTDRPTKAHEYIFLLAKQERYYYDAAAIAEEAITNDERRPYGSQGANELDPRGVQGEGKPRTGKALTSPRNDGNPWNEANGRGFIPNGLTRNRRTVWAVATQPYSGAHFATFPPALIEPCILAGCPEGGTVLDPFGGAGTTGLVADRLQRNALLIELNPTYAQMARDRIHGDAPLFADVV